MLTTVLEQCLAVRWGEGYEVLSDSTVPPFSKEMSQDINEILKTLFTITHMYHRQEPDVVKTHKSGEELTNQINSFS